MKCFNNQGELMIIVNENGSMDIDVLFPKYNWVSKHNQMSNFKKGVLRCPYSKTICNKGYIGEGVHKTWENGEKTKAYRCWTQMLTRCYNEKSKAKRSTYMDCEVCDEWLNFQNFAQWYSEHYYEVDNDKMCLDKDIVVKKNKIYLPQTCIFVPNRINVFFLNNAKNRNDLPLGLYYRNGKTITSRVTGRKTTVEEGFLLYKRHKEEELISLIRSYGNQIPLRVQNIILNYKIEITD